MKTAELIGILTVIFHSDGHVVCSIDKGVVRKGASVKIFRNKVSIKCSVVSNIRRNRDPVYEMHYGHNCYVQFYRYDKLQIGDVIEVYE